MMVRRLSCHIHRDIVKAPSVNRTSSLHVPVVLIRVVIHLILELADRNMIYYTVDPVLIDCVDDVSYVKSGNERERENMRYFPVDDICRRRHCQRCITTFRAMTIVSTVVVLIE
jgi:hypothetical protein